MSFDNTSFLFFFLPIVILAYFLVWGVEWLLAERNKELRNKQAVSTTGRNTVLLIASLVFYSWGEPIYVLLLICSSLIAWGGGLLIEHWRGTRQSLVMMLVLVSFLLLSLGIFKYLGFAIQTLNHVPCVGIPMVDVKLPIGISFFTFQILSYVIDLYRGNIGVQKNPLRLLLYVSLFPQLIAGPIVRYSTVEQELVNRQVYISDIYDGTLRFIKGLAKKVVLADTVGNISAAIYDAYTDVQTETIAPQSVGTTALWVAALAYTLQLYFDFSGYSDMAIGLGRIFGFHFLENFNFPYISRSITEFWRRWHISLSGWFRDYVYIPLGGNRLGLGRQLGNILVVWMLTGLWHGAAWNFVLWGIYYAFLLIVEKMWRARLNNQTSDAISGGHSWVTSLLKWLITFIIVNLGWVLFHIEDFDVLGGVLNCMFVWQDTDWLRLMASDAEILLSLPWLLVAFIFSFPLFEGFANSRKWSIQVIRCINFMLIFLLSIYCIYNSTFHPFIYFRF